MKIIKLFDNFNYDSGLWYEQSRLPIEDDVIDIIKNRLISIADTHEIYVSNHHFVDARYSQDFSISIWKNVLSGYYC